MGPDEPAEGLLRNDAELETDGYAAGLEVWDPLTTAYENFLGDPDLANRQLWSLREAIRQELRDELG